MATKKTYWERYVTGEYGQVWAELQALGAAVREQPLYDDALAVAHETMQRVRRNIELLIPRLADLGYRFGYESLEAIQSEIHPQVFAPPATGVTQTTDELEQRIGPLPLSLRAFYEVVGEVNFVGDIPAAWHDWRSVPDSLDAIYVYPAAVALEGAISWQEEYGDITEEEWDLPGKDEDDLCDARAYYALPRECWLVPIAPDEWHKYGISGCGGYDIAVPSATADARLLTERHRTTFVNYLRICFRWTGFPGLQEISGAPQTITALSELTRDLLPI